MYCIYTQLLIGFENQLIFLNCSYQICRFVLVISFVFPMFRYPSLTQENVLGTQNFRKDVRDTKCPSSGSSHPCFVTIWLVHLAHIFPPQKHVIFVVLGTKIVEKKLHLAMIAIMWTKIEISNLLFAHLKYL